MKKSIFCFMLASVIFLTLCVPLCAADARMKNVNTYLPDFYITSSLKAFVSASFEGYEDVTESVYIEIHIERKGWFGTWSEVEDGVWYDAVSDYEGSVSHTLDLSRTGEYRALFTFIFFGIDGSEETVTATRYYEV